MIRTILASAVAAVLSVGAASAATIGYTASDRALADTFSDFVIVLNQAAFSTGVISAWDVFIEAIDGNAGSGQMALVVLQETVPGTFNVVASDTRTVVAGINNFTGTSIAVATGQILAIWMGTAKVSYENGADGGDLYSNNGSFGSAPVGTIGIANGGIDRLYSIEATVSAVPLPATGLMLLGALGGIAALRRRKSV
jgi:hypothetical protein